jgi:hypothetical protein
MNYNMKQFRITILLTVLMSMFGVKASAHDIEVANKDGITIYYNWINNNTELAVTYKGNYSTDHQNEYIGNVVIPASVNYEGVMYNVTSIGPSAFRECSILTSITIPNSVNSIGYSAFDGTAWYDSQAEGLVYAGKVAYGYKGTMPENTQIVLNEGTLGIAEYAFAYCNNLTSITIPNSILSIGEYAFYNCISLTSITLPNSLKTISKYVFCNCTGIISVSIPNSVTSIGERSFQGCSDLASITIPNSVTVIEECAFASCSSLTSITIPNSVTSIGAYAFSHCSGLVVINVPNGITSLDGTFAGCSSLTTLTIPQSVTIIGGGTFANCRKLSSITIPEYVTSIGESAFSDCISLTSVEIPNSVTTIGESVFEKCSKIETIKLPEKLQIIKKATFKGCESLNTVSIPINVTSIEESAFYGCYSLASITIPSSVTIIGESAFSDCISLTSVEIPNNVTTIGESAFEFCSKMEMLKLPEELQIIKKASYYGCESLKSVTIPATVEYIYQDAFTNCHNLKYIKSLSETPPFLYDNSFSDFNVPVIVPSESVDAYKEAQGWKNFYNINDKTYFKLVYKVDEAEYKTYNLEIGTVITPEEEPTKEGYTFSGWSEIPGSMPAEDVTVIGTFTVNKYKIIYQVDGEEYKSYEKEYGLKITPEEAPTKEGYNFSGWSKIPETMPANDVTVTGTFTINKYKLIYQVDGENYKTYEVEYGSTITPESAPTKEGYIFSGWSTIPATMPANDVTITGSFLLATDVDEITIKEIGKTTWCSEYDLDFTNVAGIKAYTATGYNNITKTIWLTRVMEVPVGTGILVKGDAGTYKIPHANVQSAYANWFVGNLGETISIGETDGDKTNYYLSGKDGTFKSVNGNANIGKNKAYLQLPTSVFAGTRSIGISYDDEDGTTGIKNLASALSEGEGEWYTLQGQRVSKPGKGLYIRNGKKVIVR